MKEGRGATRREAIFTGGAFVAGAMFTRGSPKRKSASVRQLLVAPRREHSRKPDEARARIQQLAHGPFLELFARSAAPGWDAWGSTPTKFEAAA